MNSFERDGVFPYCKCSCIVGRLFPTSRKLATECPMTEPAKPRAVGLNRIALEVGDIEEALAFTRAFSGSNSVARVTPWPSSTLATNSSLYSKGVDSRRMTAAILVWSSMIRMRHVALLEMPASRH